MALAFDATSQNFTGYGASLTYSHTTAGADRILLVSASIESGNDNITGITYAGVAMTLVDKIANLAPNEYTYLYILVAPASGANNVVVSSSPAGFIASIAASYTGAAQTGQPDAKGKKTEAGVSSSTLSVTTIANNCWMIGVSQGDSNTPTASTGVTLRNTSIQTILGDSNGAITPAGAYSMTFTDGSQRFNIIMASIAPVGPTSSIKTFNGLVYASIKTVNGLAIASVKTINGLA